MKLFTGDISVIKNEIDELREHVCRCKNVSEARSVINTMYSLISAYYLLEGDERKEWKKISKNKYYNSKVNEQTQKSYKKFIKNFLDNKEFHRDLMLNIMLRYEDECDEINDYYVKEEIINDDKKIGIMGGFLSTMNDSDNEMFNDIISNNRIFLLNNLRDIEDCDGLSVYNAITGNGIVILSNNYKNDVYLMTTLAHEFGHLIDFKNMHDNHSLNTKNDFFYVSYYLEVMSKFYEKEFLEYLIKNNIKVESAKKVLELCYTSFFNYVGDLLLFTSLDDKYLKSNKYRDLSSEELNEILDINGSEYNLYYEKLNEILDINGSEYNLYYEKYNMDDKNPLVDVEMEDAIEYSYGNIIAIYLSYLKHNDEEKYNRVFNVFNSNKTELFNPNILDILETDNEEITNIIFEELKVIQEDSKVYKK